MGKKQDAGEDKAGKEKATGEEGCKRKGRKQDAGEDKAKRERMPVGKKGLGS